MKKAWAIIIFAAVVVALVAATVFMQGSPQSPPMMNQQNNANATVKVTNSTQNSSSLNTTTSKSLITSEDLAKHNSKSDCWVAYSDKVYDITTFLPHHPGSSAAIEPYCGTSDEFQKAFTKQHGTTKVSMLMQVGMLMGYFNKVGEM